jgi:hypothetical protein
MESHNENRRRGGGSPRTAQTLAKARQIHAHRGGNMSKARRIAIPEEALLPGTSMTVVFNEDTPTFEDAKKDLLKSVGMDAFDPRTPSVFEAFGRDGEFEAFMAFGVKTVRQLSRIYRAFDRYPYGCFCDFLDFLIDNVRPEVRRDITKKTKRKSAQSSRGGKLFWAREVNE